MAGWRVSGGRAPSGGERQRSESSEGATELGFPGPTLGQMQSEAARRAGEPSGHGKEAASQGLGGHDLLAQTDARRPACQVVGDDLDGQPGSGLAGKRPEGRWFNPTPYLRSRMAFSISAWRRWSASRCQGFPLPVGDEAVIAVGGEEGQLGTGRGLHAPDDEPHRRGVGLALEGSVAGFGHIGGAVHPVGDGRPVLLG